jgi:hypothetical protein
LKNKWDLQAKLFNFTHENHLRREDFQLEVEMLHVEVEMLDVPETLPFDA